MVPEIQDAQRQVGERLKARQIVVAPRVPDLRKERYLSPFEADGDIVVDCELCGYHAMGPRKRIGSLMREHHRMYHSEQTGVVLLNQPHQ